MFIPGCIIAIALFVFSGNPSQPDPALVQAMEQDQARTAQGR